MVSLKMKLVNVLFVSELLAYLQFETPNGAEFNSGRFLYEVPATQAHGLLPFIGKALSFGMKHD